MRLGLLVYSDLNHPRQDGSWWDQTFCDPFGGDEYIVHVLFSAIMVRIMLYDSMFLFLPSLPHPHTPNKYL
jgi:hypothetical protein